jgi:hypothetical protein
VITPTLVPNIVGVCKQIVDVLVSDGAGGQILNSEALISLPALFVAEAASGTPAVYTGLDGLELVLSINDGVDVPIAFSDPSATGLTASTVVYQINAMLQQQGVTSGQAVLLTDTTWEFVTFGKGQFQSILVDTGTSPVVATAFGIGIGHTYVGIGNYDQYETTIPEVAFPDPRSNLAELAIEADSVRVFLSTGSGVGIKEATRTDTFLRRGVVATSAVLTSTTDLTGLTYPTALLGKTLTINVDGGTDQTITFPAADVTGTDGVVAVSGTTVTFTSATLVYADCYVGQTFTFVDSVHAGNTGTFVLTEVNLVGSPHVQFTNASAVASTGVHWTIVFPADAADVLAFVQAGFSGVTAALDITGEYLSITDNSTGTSSVLTWRSSSTAPIAFLVASSTGVSIAAIDDGNGDAYTPLLQFAGYNFTAAAANAVLTASSAPTYSGLGGKTLTISDGGQPQTIVFTGSETTIAGATNSLQATIQAIVGIAAGGNISVTSSSGKLALTNTNYAGEDSIVHIVGGTALALLDPGVTPTLVAGADARGNPYPPAPGDEIWIDGALYAHVTKVAYGGNAAVLRIDAQVPVNPDVGTHFFIQAKNLVMPPLTNRPIPDLYLDLSDNVYIKASLLRDFTGAPISRRAYLSEHTHLLVLQRRAPGYDGSRNESRSSTL